MYFNMEIINFTNIQRQIVTPRTNKIIFNPSFAFKFNFRQILPRN